jgi:hypothetical protein
VLRDTVVWSMHVWGRANVLINVFTVFRASPRAADEGIDLGWNRPN